MSEKVLGFKNYWKKQVKVQARQMDKPFVVETLEGTMEGKKGDYLVRGIEGEEYPVDREIFEKTYTDKPESVVSLKWLEKYIKKQRKLIAGYKTKNPFLEGHYDGRIEALEVLLTEAKKKAGE